MALSPGGMLSHYRLVEKIGEGGMGVVWKADDTVLGRQLAIKVLREELASDPERLRRFEQEARSASALNHPNIVTIYDIGKHRTTPYIAMEFVEGRTLREIFSEGPLPTKELLQVAIQIAEGLAKAHSAGIVHRDLKPENLMVTRDEYVKILDFGLAKLLPQPGVNSMAATMTKEGTAAGTVMGTASYMSPEQALGKPLDARTDVFSLGAVIYEMSTGRKAFQGETPAGLFDEILHKPPASPSHSNSELSSSFDRIINKALEKDAEKRYPTAAEFSVDLNAIRIDMPMLELSTQKSIVVLPFENISPDPEQEYFCDGLTEEIISDLSKVGALRVISRTSAMTFKGTKKKVHDIADEVNVRYVLEGSVRKAGNSLRITAQLIEAANDAHLWSEKYSGALDDVFDIQEKVSRSIVDALKVTITPEENSRIAERPIDNVQVYECYLKSREEYWKWTEEGLERAHQLIQTGLKILGENELFYVALGTIYAQYIHFAIKKDERYLVKAEECIERVFALNAESSRGHYLRGFTWYLRGKMRKAISELKTSLVTDPNDSDAMMILGWIYATSGKDVAARRLLRKALELDPVNPIAYGHLSGSEMFEGKGACALTTWSKGHSMDPDNPWFRFYYAFLHTQNHNRDEACEYVDLLVKEAPESIWAQLGLFLKCALQGDARKASVAVTEELRTAMQRNDLYPLLMADCYAMLNEKEEAINWLEEAIKWGCINYPFLNEYDPLLENIRGEERFKKLMKRVKYEWEHFEI
jgi:serine/threonine protein kinase/lipoprotein NlpI